MSEERRVILCPYCGHPQADADRCDECGGLFEPLSRKATQIAMGPWFLRDPNRPFHPGCSYEVLKRQIELGRVKPTSILRGPTTHQFWALAKNVPGVGHLLGYCHRCGAKVSADDERCAGCREPFMAILERNKLGLAYKTPAEAQAAQKDLERQVAEQQAKAAATAPEVEAAQPAQEEHAAASAAVGVSGLGLDLLDEVIGRGPKGSMAEAASSGRKSHAGPRSDAAAQPSPENRVLSSVGSAADDDMVTHLERRNRRLSLTTWLLVGFNIVVLAAVVLLLWQYSRPAMPQEREAGSSMRQREPAPETPPQEAPAPAPANPRAEPAPQVIAPPAAPAPAIPPADGEELSADPNAPLDRVSAGLAEARRLEREGKLPEALQRLQKLAQETPLRDRPASLDDDIRRLQARIAKENSTPFFQDRP